MFHPGAMKFGNFINYYSFNSANARLQLLPSEFWTHANHWEICLDIGCNTGELTRALQKRISEITGHTIEFLAVDLDKNLIDRAIQSSFEGIRFVEADVSSSEFHQLVKNYLAEKGAKCFDAVFAFSVTMWIHLHHGDNGLDNILSKLADQSKYFIIEPQPFRCYTAAARRMRRVGQEDQLPKLKEITVKKDVESHIHELLTKKNNMTLLFHSEISHWGRTIYLYSKGGLCSSC